MPLNFQPPSFAQPRQYPNIAQSLDQAFSSAIQAKLQQEQLDLQKQQLARQEKQDIQNLASQTAQRNEQLARTGIDFSKVTPEDIQASYSRINNQGPYAQQPQQPPQNLYQRGLISPPNQLPKMDLGLSAGAKPYEQPQTDLGRALDEYVSRARSERALGMRKEELEIKGKETGIKKDIAQIGLSEAEAAVKRKEALLGPKSAIPNQSEFTARGFADKATQANSNLDSLVGKGFDPSSLSSGAQGLSFNSNWLKSSEVQRYEQAKLQFVNAILRRESGAAIPEDEMRKYTLQYFPVSGDSAETLEQKASARRLAIAGLDAEASRVPSQVGNKYAKVSDEALLGMIYGNK